MWDEKGVLPLVGWEREGGVDGFLRRLLVAEWREEASERMEERACLFILPYLSLL